MKASELRLGNKIIRNKIIVTVDEQTFWDFKNYPEQYNPIPITEDCLLKFGFEKESSFYIFGDVDKKHFEIKINNGIKFRHSTSLQEAELKFIHQLQNLFFSLCGEELELK